MGPATFVMVVGAVIVAFWAGSRWRHHRRSRSDYRTMSANAGKALVIRRAALKAVIPALLATALYVVVTAKVSMSAQDKKQTPSPSPHPSAVTHSPSPGPLVRPGKPSGHGHS